METGLAKEAKEELLSKLIQIREMRLNIELRSCKGSSTLKRKMKLTKLKTKMSDKGKSINIA